MVNRCSQGGVSYKELKEMLVEQYLAYFKDAREKYKKISNDTNYLEKVLTHNRKKLDKFFTERLKKVKQILGVS